MSGPVPSVRSAIRLIQYVAEHPDTRGRDAARALELNPSTCHDILKTLVNGGMLEFDVATKRYRLGPTLVALGGRAWEETDYTRVTRPLLEQWVAETRFTVFVVRPLPNHEFVVVDKVASPHNIKVTVDLAERFPLTTAAIGKAYLTCLPREQAAALLEQAGLPAFTPWSITDVADFLAEVDQARVRGWSEARQEYFSFTNAVAAPIRGPHQRAELIVCSLAATTDMSSDRLEHHGRAIRQLANLIGEAVRSGAPRAHTGGR